MAQYRAGTATTTQGQSVVIGTSTGWSTQVAAGNLFCITGEGVYYDILSVQSDTQLTLASNYVAVSKTNASYQIQTSFTPNNGYPIPGYGDSDTAALYAQTLLKIDAQLAALSPVAPVLQGTITVAGALELGFATTSIPNLTSRNAVMNGNFAINQRSYVSGTALAAGAYGHDRWKAGVSGCTYNFTQATPDTLISITAGSLCEIIDKANVYASAYWLSWVGTAQARYYQSGTPGAYSAGTQQVVGGITVNVLPVTGLIIGGMLTIEFEGGTLGTVQLEAGPPGSGSTMFERRHVGQELALCQRFFWSYATSTDYFSALTSLPSGQLALGLRLQFPVPMRAAPITTMNVQTNGAFVSGFPQAANVSAQAAFLRGDVTAPGSYSYLTAFTASADL